MRSPARPGDAPGARRSRKCGYDVIIIGGGGHGLATAYYLAANHGLSRGGHRAGLYRRGQRRSQHHAGALQLHARRQYPILRDSLKLWEGLSHELNYNVMLSQRGQVVLAHGPSQLDVLARKGNIMRLNGIDAELLDRDEVHADTALSRFLGAVAVPHPWRAAATAGGHGASRCGGLGLCASRGSLGVDIIENCEVTGFIPRASALGTSVYRSRDQPGRIHAERTAISVAGHSSHLSAMAGLRIPVESHLLQAFVTEPIKPFVDHVISFGAELFYISQSDKGGLVFGGHIDGFNCYTQRGQFPKVQTVAECAVALIPSISRLRLLRHWAGIQE